MVHARLDPRRYSPYFQTSNMFINVNLYSRVWYVKLVRFVLFSHLNMDIDASISVWGLAGDIY